MYCTIAYYSYKLISLCDRYIFCFDHLIYIILLQETYEMTLAREHAQEDPVSMRSDRDEKDPYKNGQSVK